MKYILVLLWLAGCHQAAQHGEMTISKPAHGNLDEVDASLTIDQKLEELKDVNLHADQCRAVLGPLPTVSCPDAPIVPVTKNGAKMTYGNGVFSEDGKPTNWTPQEGCDHPGLLSFLRASLITPGTKGDDPVEGCIPNPRIGVTHIGPVTWAYSCHFFTGNHERHDKFDFVALLGTNDKTGETCFFSHDFQEKEEKKFIGKNVIPPGGWQPTNPHERRQSGEFWNPTDYFVCMECHGNNKPMLMTPHITQTGFLPETPLAQRMNLRWGFRVIGVDNNLYMNHKFEFDRKELHERPEAIWPKHDDGTEDHSCTSCHTLTNQENFLRLARQAVGLPDLERHIKVTGTHVVDPQPWMPPMANRRPRDVAEAQAAVKRFERAFHDEKWRARPAESLLSPCPPPPPLDAKAVSVEIAEARLRASWTWKNAYGDVATRDDVRFVAEITGSDGSRETIRDIAPEQLGSDRWHLALAAKKDVGYTVEVKPYRYCFDETIYSYGPATRVEVKR